MEVKSPAQGTYEINGNTYHAPNLAKALAIADQYIDPAPDADEVEWLNDWERCETCGLRHPEPCRVGFDKYMAPRRGEAIPFNGEPVPYDDDSDDYGLQPPF